MEFIATKHTTNNYGIGIIDIDHTEDKIVFATFGLGQKWRKVKSKIRYTASGEPYFMSMSQRQYLDDFVRTNI